MAREDKKRKKNTSTLQAAGLQCRTARLAAGILIITALMIRSGISDGHGS